MNRLFARPKRANAILSPSPSIRRVVLPARRHFSDGDQNRFSSGSKARFQIPSHVFHFMTILVIPCGIIYAIMKPNEKSLEEKEAELEAKYGAQIARQRERTRALNEFVRRGALADGADADAERLMQDVFKAGKKKVIRVDVREDGVPDKNSNKEGEK